MNEISFETLDEIIDTAGLYFAEPSDGRDAYEDSESVSIRPAYRGRGYVREGFGLVLAPSALHAVLAAAGLVARDHEDDDREELDAVDFARGTETDNMGRSDIIAYWPGWTITNLPEVYTKD